MRLCKLLLKGEKKKEQTLIPCNFTHLAFVFLKIKSLF